MELEFDDVNATCNFQIIIVEDELGMEVPFEVQIDYKSDLGEEREDKQGFLDEVLDFFAMGGRS